MLKDYDGYLISSSYLAKKLGYKTTSIICRKLRALEKGGFVTVSKILKYNGTFELAVTLK